MLEFDADLHIHSPYSIGVSKRMTVPNIAAGAVRKGISIVGTGDATQPDWLRHLQTTLKRTDDTLSFQGVYFVLTVEIEDRQSIHHVVVLPDFDTVESLRRSLAPHSTNIDRRWGGRPRVDLSAEELAGVVRDTGGIIGPAHAFTPYRSIFREGMYESLAACYGSEASAVRFLELGLSADTETADHIPELRTRTFLTSSDAHSPSPEKLGREFVRLRMEAPSFDELKRALFREGGRRPVLNVGLDPRLGKYYLSFCSSCRRTLVVRAGDEPPSFDRLNVYFSVESAAERSRLLRSIHERKVRCPACGKPLRLGVRDRAMMIGEPESRSPSHRPPYLHMPPLLELIRATLETKSTASKRVRSLYDRMIETLGPETKILTTNTQDEIAEVDERVARTIIAYRRGAVGFVPGGGGRYGKVVLQEEGE